MVIALVKDGIVTNKISVPDGSTLVALANPGDANVTDLYDGSAFMPNPEAAALRAAASKKQDILRQIQSAADDAAVNALLASLDALYNP